MLSGQADFLLCKLNKRSLYQLKYQVVKVSLGRSLGASMRGGMNGCKEDVFASSLPLDAKNSNKFDYSRQGLNVPSMYPHHSTQNDKAPFSAISQYSQTQPSILLDFYVSTFIRVFRSFHKKDISDISGKYCGYLLLCKYYVVIKYKHLLNNFVHILI